MSTPALTKEQAWAEVDRCAESTVRFAYRLGRALAAAKEITPHGEWTEELRKRKISQPAASRAMQVVREMTESEFLEHGSQRQALEAIKANHSRANDSETKHTESHAATASDPSPAYHGQQLEDPPVPPPPEVREALERTGIGLATKQNEDPSELSEALEKSRDDRKRARSKHHPAPYSEGLFPIFADLISSVAVERSQVKLLDPMCGEGSILDISKHLPGVAFQVHASDLYRWTYAREGVHTADATDLAYPDSIFDVICTSPPYANRMADSASGDGDNRVIYADRRESEQIPNDVAAMQWGQQYRLTMSAIWAECVRVAKPGALIIMNCKDHIRLGRIQPVTEFNFLALVRLGCIPTALRFLLTSGVQGVANASLRTGFETVVAFTTPTKEQA